QNDGKYCNGRLDVLLNQARTVNDVAQRQALYNEALSLLADEVPTAYLYFDERIIALSINVNGFVPKPDGLISMSNVAI
ncbi:ABC transporter substrate-binding protein, partial [Pseudomonas syringae pv. tagetis]